MLTNQYKYTVCIHCMTYNQKPYILDALYGFAIQQTDFPFVAIVMDDASTDGEPEVLRQYIAEQCDVASLTTKDNELYELVEIDAKDNQNCHFAFYFLKQNLFRTDKKKPIIAEWDDQAKYIAICEGDDYWTDPLKLQRQVDFLECHLDYSMCFHKCSVLNVQTGVLRQEEVRDIQGESSIIDVAEGNYIHTLSVVYRTDIRLSIDREKISKNLAVGDYILWLLLAQYGRIWKMPDVMGVYREQCGIWSSQKCSYTQPRWVELLHHMVNYFEPRNLQVSELLMKQMIDAIALPMADYEQQVEKLTRELLNVHHSKAYRLGNCILKPLKLIFRK